MALLPHLVPQPVPEEQEGIRTVSLPAYDRWSGGAIPEPPAQPAITPHILSPEWQRQYEALRALLQRALWLAEKRADYEATQILRARLTNLQAPALLVIVGEVKAGKSSFINALVRENVCEVAPGPCTTRIQELIYGAERTVASLSQSWERISLPQEVLREVTIVDTPGTNSIIKDHQTITERYIPQSDLIVFVFSAVNPHTKSAWELLSMIRKDWYRKMVFVLQQADRATAQELAINREHVRQYAREREVEEPTLFILSAKLEMEGAVGSGFSGFRHYLQDAIAGGEVWRLKVEGAYKTTRAVMGKLLAHLHIEQESVAEERAFYHDLLQKVEAREAKASSLKQLIVSKISATYDELARRSEDEFAQRLGVGKLLSRALPFRRDTESDNWMDDLKVRFQESARKEIASEARRVSKELADELQTMMEELTQSIAQRQEGIREKAALPHTASGAKLLDELRAKLGRMRVGDAIVGGSVADSAGLSRLAMAGGGLAIVGMLIAALSENPWLDLSGVAFATFGILLIVAGLLWRRADMLREFRQQLGVSRKEFHERLEFEFSQIFDGLFYDVHQALEETVFRLDLHASHLEPVVAETFRLSEAASEQLLNFQRNIAPPRFASV